MTAPGPTARKKLTWIADDLEYYPHQIDGVRQLVKMGSHINADDMGLGKTLETLTVFAVDVEKGWADQLLFVTLATLKENVKDDIFEHTLFRNVMILEGSPRERKQQLADFAAMPKPRILIVNYEQVTAHSAELNALGFQDVAYDEAHNITNPRAKRTKACHALTGDRHMILTGSPMKNNVDELWSLLYRIAPREFPSYYAFRNRYCVFGGFKNKQIVGVKNERELNEIMQRYMLRRLKTDVLDLPDKQIIPVRVPLHPEQQALYDEVMMNMELPRPDEAEPEAIENALTKFLRLKQICGTTATIEGYEDRSFKLDTAMNQITGEFAPNGYPYVVFTQFRGVQAAMMQRHEMAGIDYRVLHGDIPTKDRVPIVRAWAEDNKRGRFQALICMSQVAGVGLNMTAARHAIRLDKLWVPALNEQCEDRLWRIGADDTQPVQIFDYIARRTVESRVEAILRRKKRLFEDVVEDADYRRKLYAALVADDDD